MTKYFSENMKESQLAQHHTTKIMNENNISQPTLSRPNKTLIKQALCPIKSSMSTYNHYMFQRSKI